MIFESFFTFLSKIFFFSSYVNNKGSFPQPLNEKEEADYIARMHNGDAEAREVLIRHNLRLVAHIAKKYSNAAEADDLISVGSIGLVKGIDTFQTGKGSALGTYAARCIQNEILMFIRKNKRHDRDVSIFDIISSDKDGNETIRMDTLCDGSDSIIDKVETKIMYERIVEAVEKHLDEREKQIVKLRYGIPSGITHTQFEVAKSLGISRSYVSRIEKKAILRLCDIINN